MEVQDMTENLHELNEVPFHSLLVLNGSYLHITANVPLIFFVAHTAQNFLLIFIYEGCSKSIGPSFFPPKQIKHGKCPSLWMWRGHLCACVNFFPLTDSVSHRQSVDDCVRVVSAQWIVNYCKMTERIEQRYYIKFCQKLGDTQVETIRKIQQAFGGRCHEYHTNKRVVQPLQRWRHISGQ